MSGKPPLSMADRVILGLHSVLAAGLGVAGFLDTASSNDGMGGLARVVVALLVGVWIAGVVVSGLLARFATARSWMRTAVVALGPVVVLLGLVVSVRA